MGTSTAPRSRRVIAATAGEDVLCVPRTTIFPDGAWHGLVTSGLDRVVRIIGAASHYACRDEVESDPAQQQIIPYCVVRDPALNLFLLSRRLQASSEQRLHNLYSLGIGGHINPGDGEGGNPVALGLRREWAEEVICEVAAQARLIAVINDDSTPVSSVHLGLVYLVDADSHRTRIREREKLEGSFLSLQQMRNHYPDMESWSQLVYDHLAGGGVEELPAASMVELPPAV